MIALDPFGERLAAVVADDVRVYSVSGHAPPRLVPKQSIQMDPSARVDGLSVIGAWTLVRTQNQAQVFQYDTPWRSVACRQAVLCHEYALPYVVYVPLEGGLARTPIMAEGQNVSAIQMLAPADATVLSLHARSYMEKSLVAACVAVRLLDGEDVTYGVRVYINESPSSRKEPFGVVPTAAMPRDVAFSTDRTRMAVLVGSMGGGDQKVGLVLTDRASPWPFLAIVQHNITPILSMACAGPCVWVTTSTSVYCTEVALTPPSLTTDEEEKVRQVHAHVSHTRASKLAPPWAAAAMVTPMEENKKMVRVAAIERGGLPQVLDFEPPEPL